MSTPKACKWCGSIWHSKNKCDKREKQALPEGFIQKGTTAGIKARKPLDRLRMPHKGKSERSQLIGEADKYHSAHVRSRGGDGVWNTCYTCGFKVMIDEIQNGHFMSRRFINTRWTEINTNPQCNNCNVVLGGNPKAYERRLRIDYGDEAIDNLKTLARSGKKFTATGIQDIIDKYNK